MKKLRRNFIYRIVAGATEVVIVLNAVCGLHLVQLAVRFAGMGLSQAVDGGAIMVIDSVLLLRGLLARIGRLKVSAG